MRIGIDFDDVVANSGIAIIEYYNKKNGTHFKKSDFHDFRFEEVWGVAPEEQNKEFDEFFALDQEENINPVIGALKAIEVLKAKGYELYIITGRQDKDIQQTESWIEKHLPRVFEGLHFAASRKKIRNMQRARYRSYDR